MKKNVIIMLFYAFLILLPLSCLILNQPYPSHLEAATPSEKEQLKQLQCITQDLNNQLSTLNSHLTAYEKSTNNLERRLSELENSNASMQSFLVDYYIDKLKDPTYVDIYDLEHPLYIAAENLGAIGKPAIPSLINRLNTNDDYERALTLYALLLASQADNVTSFTGGEYIHTRLDFDARNHPAQVKLAMDWWEKYKSYF